MSYTLLSHPKQYELSDSESRWIGDHGLSFAPYSKRHFELGGIGHGIIGTLELIPLLGGLVVLIERLAVAIFQRFFPNDLIHAIEKRKLRALIETYPMSYIFYKIVNKDNNEPFNPEACTFELHINHLQVISKMQNWKFLTEIPDEFHQDPELAKYTCGISSKPIRHALRVVNTNILYDREHLKNWRREHPGELSPEGSDFGVQPDKEVQALIDKRLTEISNKIQRKLTKKRIRI